jgi:ATP-dependent DNA helicase RecG
MHGKMHPDHRDEVMTLFSEGKIDILVSTTVVEVGVNVPNATIMAIENAERFGLAQLHQLRGRVGRGEHKSYCILITDSKSKICRERLKAMKDSNDGFYISELDLKLRGSGDFFGTRQHGLSEFKIANLYQDLEILKEVQAAAEEVASDYGDEGWVVI